MSVYVERLIIRNFRSCRAVDVCLDFFTPLIGYNNSGKSNIISALQWLLRRSVLAEADFNDPSEAIEVVGHVSGLDEDSLDCLSPQQQRQVEKYVRDGQIIIKRMQSAPGVRAADIKLWVINPDSGEWSPNPTGIDNAISVMLPEPIRIGAMENAAEDSAKAKTTTTIGKLLAEFIGPVREAHEQEINDHLGQVKRRLSADGDARLDELAVIDESINARISDLFPGVGLKLHFPTPTVDELIKSGTVKVFEGENALRDFSAYGHGAQRAIQMALVRHLAEVKRGEARHTGTTLLLIDEPELYLHPFAIEHIREALKSLSASGYQVIFSTHSAQMIKAVDAQNALLIRKSEDRGTHARKKLRAAIQNVVPNSTHAMEQLFTLSHSSQILFADKVVLTEGKTELRLMPFLFEQHHSQTLGQHKVALVSQSGACDTKRSMDILREMDLPAKAVVDLDYGMTAAVKHGFVDPDDANIAALKSIFVGMEAAGRISLASNGLPCRGVVSASEAYALLAQDPDAVGPIAALHDHLRRQNIWMWTRGAVEQHLGLTRKDEAAWADLQNRVDQRGLCNVVADPQGIVALLDWIRE